MRKEYDFSGGERGAGGPSPRKTRLTLMLGDGGREYFRIQADSSGTGYQTMINAVLKNSVHRAKTGDEELTVAKLREVIRQELHAA